MKRRQITFIGIACLVFIIIMSFCSFAVSSVPEDVLKANDSVLRIFAGDYTGSGFVISSDEKNTYVATNYHVIEDDPDGAFIWLSDESNINASVLVADKERDICILKIGFPLGITPITLASIDAEKGDAVYAIGFPGAADLYTDSYALDSDSTTITDGIVSATREMDMDGSGIKEKFLQINAAINPGNSGGPVLNEKGEAIGISTLGDTESQGIFGAIAISEIKKILDDNGITYIVPKETTTTPIWIFIVGGVVFLALIAIIIVLTIKLKRKTKAEISSTSEVADETIKDAPSASDVPETNCINTSDQDDIEPHVAESESKGKKPIQWKKVIIITIAVLFAIVVIGYIVTFVLSHKASNNHEYNKASNLLILKPITKLHDKYYVDYVNAGALIENGKYDEAKEIFNSLGGYLDSSKMVTECDYQKAKSLLEDGQYEEAKTAFEKLGDYSDANTQVIECDYQKAMSMLNNGQYTEASEFFDELKDYKDSQNMSCESLYRYAEKCLEEQDYNEARKTFSSLAQKDYKDSKDRFTEAIVLSALDEYDNGNIMKGFSFFRDALSRGYKDTENLFAQMQEGVYSYGQNLYRSGSYVSAKRPFSNISGYKDSDKYLTLIDALVGDEVLYHPAKVIEKIINIIDFEDAKKVLVYDSCLATEFLKGKWRTEGGGYYFEIKENADGSHQSSYNLPVNYAKGYFHINKGVFSVGDNDTKYFKFDVIGPDEMYVHCYADGYDYYMYR